MSVKGKMMHVMMRYRHLFKGKLRPDRIDRNTSVTQLRAETDEAAAKLVKIPAGITITPADFDGCYAEWVAPVNVPEDKVVLYFHGGGFVMGNAKSHRGIVSGFVMRLGVKALVFDYSLAPEHPAPAAVNDAAEIYGWLLAQGYQPNNILFAGDSAGGGVELSTMLKLKDDGVALPAACVAFSPCTDVTMSGESHTSRLKADPCTPPGMTETFLSYYVAGGDARHPYASALFGDLAGLPPIMIQVGNDETLRDDSVRFAERARQAGVDVRIKVWQGMFHCFPLLAPMFPEATAAMDEVAAFVAQQLGKGAMPTTQQEELAKVFTA